MSTYMSREVLAGVVKASKEKATKSSHLRVKVGDDVFPILSLTDDRFSLEARNAPKLRGYVDILDGTQLKCRALIIASEIARDERIFEFKRSTSVATGPALDFVRRDDAPADMFVGYNSAS